MLLSPADFGGKFCDRLLSENWDLSYWSVFLPRPPFYLLAI
jgi:hypothetical protein